MHRILFIVLAVFLVSPAIAQSSKLAKWEVEADTAMSLQDYPKAIKIYTRILKASKLKQRGDYGVLYKRAVCYYSSGDYKQALVDLNDVVPQFPQMPQAKMLRALTHKELGNDEKKLEDLKQALLGDPANPTMLKWRASVYLEEEEYELAKTDLQTAKLFTDDAETEMYLGVAQYNSGAVDSAFQSLDKSIELDAAYMPAYLYAGSFCLEQDRYEQAIQYLTFAGQLEPKNTTVFFYKGIALVELDKTEEGCRYLRKAFYGGLDDASAYMKESCFGVEN
ncbi:MAG TPA: tetratricopeptide repeat protein [Cyclobacteriaceae bacterium]|nr:tetratricopeptide repeat protein [Cyclobacteriaceae bacterium]